MRPALKLAPYVLVGQLFFTVALTAGERDQLKKAPIPVEVKLSVTSTSFTLHDPIDVIVEVSNTGRTAQTLRPISRSSISLRPKGDASGGVVMVPGHCTGLFGGVKLAARAKKQQRFALYNLVLIKKAGTYEFGYHVVLEVLDQEGAEGARSKVGCVGTLRLIVKGRSAEQIRQLTSGISLALEKKKHPPETLKELLPILSPEAIPALCKAWDVYRKEHERRQIIDALVRIGSPSAVRHMETFALSASSPSVRLNVVSGPARLVGDPDVLKVARVIWLQGLSDTDEAVRLSCVSYLSTYSLRESQEALKSMLRDSSARVRRAAQQGIKKQEEAKAD